MNSERNQKPFQPRHKPALKLDLPKLSLSTTPTKSSPPPNFLQPKPAKSAYHQPLQNLQDRAAQTTYSPQQLQPKAVKSVGQKVQDRAAQNPPTLNPWGAEEHPVQATQTTAPSFPTSLSTNTTSNYQQTPLTPQPQRSLLSRISKAHMAVILCVGAVIVMIIGAQPGPMNASQNNLKDVVVGAGSGDAQDMAEGAKTQLTTPEVQPKAIKSAGQEVQDKAVKGEGDVIKMNGIPSPSLAAALDPSNTLPFTPDDGVSLPDKENQRDSHAVDTHYGKTQTLPMEKPIERPVMTPGESIDHAALKAAEQQLSRGGLSHDYL